MEIAKIKKTDLLPDFTERLNYWYKKKWTGTQDAFAEAILSYMTDKEKKKGSCDKKYVSNWLNGRWLPLKYLPAICKVLDVDLSEFVITSFADKYHYSPSFVIALEKQLAESAEKNYKIDLTFFQGIRNIIPDFGSRFPVFTPLRFYEDEAFRKPYERQESAGTVAPAGADGIFRITRNGNTVFLTGYDMKLIKYLQEYLKRCACHWFEKVSMEMIASEKKANLRYQEINTDPFVLEELSDEELQQLDPWGMYTEKEKKKYYFGDDAVEMSQEEFFGKPRADIQHEQDRRESE